MTFTCPHCHKQHRLPEGVVLPPNSAAHCKKCGKRFLLDGAVGDQSTPEPTLDKMSEVATSPAEAPGTTDGATAAILDAFPELRGLPPGQFVLNEMFIPGAGERYQTRRNRLLAKLLIATAPLLTENILQKDELVCRIARGIAYFPFEIPYANGLLTWPLNYYALVATNHRLIFINLDYRFFHPTHYIFQIPFDSIARVSRGFYGSSLIVTTGAGRTWDFTTINRRLASGLEKFVRGQLEQLVATGSEGHSPSQLCPACYQPVPEKLVSCPHCLIPYKSARVAIKKSMLLPGTGNIYLSNSYLGIIEILGYLFTWVMTIVLVIIGIPGGILGGGLLVVGYHLMAAIMAGKMAGKGYMMVDTCPEKDIPEQNEVTS